MEGLVANHWPLQNNHNHFTRLFYKATRILEMFMRGVQLRLRLIEYLK